MGTAGALGRATCAGLFAAALALAAASALCAEDTALAQEVKAAYLYKLALFVEWPASVFESPAAPVTICVLDDDTLAAPLEKVLAGKKRGRRPIVSKRLKRARTDAGCQIIYIPDSDQSAPEALQTLEGAPVLTVTETEAADRRGMVNFVRHDNRVRFEIDEAEAARDGVGISAKLLELALSVRRKS